MFNVGWLSFFFVNFGLIMLLLSIIIALIDWPIQRIYYHQKNGYEVFFRWISFIGLGITGFYSAIMHIFLPHLASSTIGWTNSPFQYEVGIANLAFAVLATLSFNAPFNFRFAMVVGYTIWFWGDALGHIYQMITNHNFASGNAGSWFWIDVIIPFVLVFLISKLKRQESNL